MSRARPLALVDAVALQNDELARSGRLEFELEGGVRWEEGLRMSGPGPGVLALGVSMLVALSVGTACGDAGVVGEEEARGQVEQALNQCLPPNTPSGDPDACCSGAS